MYKFSINRPITTLMIFLSLMFFGFMSMQKMSINLFPEVKIPLIKITTIAKGDKNLIENQISKKIEDEVFEIDGIKSIKSYSYNNYSVVFVHFQLSKDIDIAANDIRDKVSKLDLGGFVPRVEKVSGDSNRILNIFVSGSNDYELSNFVEEKLRPFLQKIKGVSKVGDVGYLKTQLKIFLDPVRLNKFRLSPNEIVNIIKTQNFKAPLGKIINDKNEIFLKSDFDAKSIDDIKDIRIKDDLFLKDIADVKLELADVDAVALMNNKKGILLEIFKVNGFNGLGIVDDIKQKLKNFDDRFNIDIVFDSSINIKKHIRQVSFDMILGIILTILIVYIFLRNLSATIIAALCIPTSIIGTFFLIDVLGYDLNRLTLIALTLGIGIFVDDAIVVIENISKKMQEGQKNPLLASFEGVREISFSVLGISAVLLCVFVPIAFMDGIVGLYFNSFALSVSGGIIVSFFVCIMFIPSMSARFLNPKEGFLYHKTEAFFVMIENSYEKILFLILKFKKTFVFLSLLILIFLIALLSKVGMDFLPIEDNAEFEIYLKAKPGISINAMSQETKKVLAILNKDKNINHSYALIGYDLAKESFKSKIYVKLKDISQRNKRQSEIMDEYRKNLKLDNISFKVSPIAIVDAGGVNEPVQLSISGPDIDELNKIGLDAQKILKNIKGLVDVGSYNDDLRPEFEIYVDKLKAKHIGVNEAQIAQNLSIAFGGNNIGSLETKRNNYDIIVRLDDKFRTKNDLGHILVKNNNGQDVSLDGIIDIKESFNKNSINRLNRERQILLVANVEGISLDKVQNVINEEIPKILPKDYSYKMHGFLELLDETNAAFKFTISLSVLLIYMILAALYESFILPLIIMISMPLAFGGVAAGLFFSSNPFSLFVMIGSILLFGMVGKNAILLVDFANKYVKDGMNINEAIVLAGKKRLRAILMTSFAMIFAMLPLAISKGAGFEGNSPMAISIISGLISSTVLTLLIVPALFGVIYKIDVFVRKIYERNKI